MQGLVATLPDACSTEACWQLICCICSKCAPLSHVYHVWTCSYTTMIRRRKSFNMRMSITLAYIKNIKMQTILVITEFDGVMLKHRITLTILIVLVLLS